MNSFVETISPAAKNHLEARFAYFNDAAQAMVQSMQKLAEVNLQFSRDWLQSSTFAMQAALAPASEREDIGLPSVETMAQKMQAYQQQLAQIASDFQNSINAVARQHVPQTTRTAAQLADVVAQKAAAQTDQQLRLQKSASDKLIDQASAFAQMATQTRAMEAPASMQSADEGNKS